VHDNGIHEFVIHEISRPAVDEFIAAMQQMALSRPGVGFPVLVDSRVGILPLSYLLRQARELVEKTPHPQNNSRLVLILNPNVLMNTIELFMRIMPATKIRFFPPEKYAEAVAWLLAGPSASGAAGNTA
jgi:hypothetical protein